MGCDMQVNRLTQDVIVLADQAPIPGLGTLPINAFVLHGSEPLVVDTGLSTPGTGFLDALSSVVAPEDVRWIFLTHPDRDHTGALFELLDLAPQARLITTFLGVGILGCEFEVPMHRVHFLNPGQSVIVGDRRIRALRPPLFDSPATVGFLDERTNTLVSSDCFGAPLAADNVTDCTDVRDLVGEELRDQQLLWAAVDSPWVHGSDRVRFRAGVEQLRALRPSGVLSSHLPPLVSDDAIDHAFEAIASAPDAPPWVGPDQQALERLLASFEPATSDPVRQTGGKAAQA